MVVEIVSRVVRFSIFDYYLFVFLFLIEYSYYFNNPSIWLDVFLFLLQNVSERRAARAEVRNIRFLDYSTTNYSNPRVAGELSWRS